MHPATFFVFITVSLILVATTNGEKGRNLPSVSDRIHTIVKRGLWNKLFGLTARQFIMKTRKGSINREFPSQWLDKTSDEIEAAAKRGDPSARKAKKLLIDNRFKKG